MILNLRPRSWLSAWIVARTCAGAVVADQQFPPHEILDRLHGRGLVGDADVGFSSSFRARELGRIELRAGIVGDRAKRSTRAINAITVPSRGACSPYKWRRGSCPHPPCSGR